MVDLERFNDLWGYAIEPLVHDRSKVRSPTKRDTGVYVLRRWSPLASGTRLLNRLACASEPVTVYVSTEEDHLLKKAKLESAKSGEGGRRYRANCLPEPRKLFKRDTDIVDLATRVKFLVS